MIEVKVVNKGHQPLPAYSTPQSAGMDLRANLSEPVTLHPMERRLIPTGLHIALPEGYEAQIRPRSGLALKKGITVLNSPGTVDADYRGEVGVLLIKYNNQMATWLIILMGVMFFLSGVYSCASYFIDSRNVSDTVVYDADGHIVAGLKPSFPFAGVGSVILGAILTFMPNTFIDFLMYILAAILILGAINLFVGLAAARKFASIGWGWWIMPSILLLIGIVAIIRPLSLFSMPYLLLGWALLVYGVTEIINAMMIARCRREAMKMREEQEAAKAEPVAVEEKKEEDPKEEEPKVEENEEDFDDFVS